MWICRSIGEGINKEKTEPGSGLSPSSVAVFLRRRDSARRMLDGGPELRSRPGGSSLAATGHHKEISIGMLVAETNILKHIRGRSYRNVVIFLHEQINTADIDIQVRYVSGLLSEERGSC
jgi:hypothetical protein